MTFPKDRAARLTREFRRICRDISDAEARDIETLLRSELTEERAEGFSDGRAFNPVADLPEGERNTDTAAALARPLPSCSTRRASRRRR